MTPEPPKVRTLDELYPPFREKLLAAIEDAKAAGLDPVVIETTRTLARQEWLYEQGRFTNPGHIVTKCDGVRHLSMHQRDLAADVAPRVNGVIDWSRRDLFDQWGAIATANGLAWGGHFPSYDGPHVEWSGSATWKG